jgi:hypothetical protein
MKIGAVANVAVLTCALLLYLLRRAEVNDLVRHQILGLRRAPLLVSVAFSLVCALAVMEIVQQPKDGDTGLYHLQTIKWIEAYGAVPGLGNLHEAYAWNSMWYPLHVLFGFSFLNIPTVLVVNGAIFVVGMGYFLGGVTDVIARPVSFTSIVKAALPLCNRHRLGLHRHARGAPADRPAARQNAVRIWCARRPLPDRVRRCRVLGCGCS